MTLPRLNFAACINLRLVLPNRFPEFVILNNVDASQVGSQIIRSYQSQHYAMASNDKPSAEHTYALEDIHGRLCNQG